MYKLVNPDTRIGHKGKSYGEKEGLRDINRLPPDLLISLKIANIVKQIKSEKNEPRKSDSPGKGSSKGKGNKEKSG